MRSSFGDGTQRRVVRLHELARVLLLRSRIRCLPIRYYHVGPRSGPTRSGISSKSCGSPGRSWSRTTAVRVSTRGTGSRTRYAITTSAPTSCVTTVRSHESTASRSCSATTSCCRRAGSTRSTSVARAPTWTSTARRVRAPGDTSPTSDRTPPRHPTYVQDLTVLDTDAAETTTEVVSRPTDATRGRWLEIVADGSFRPDAFTLSESGDPNRGSRSRHGPALAPSLLRRRRCVPAVVGVRRHRSAAPAQRRAADHVDQVARLTSKST